jgi:hypothetical protein
MISFYNFHLAARAILLGLPSPVTRRGQKFFKPALWGHLRQVNENAALVDSARDQSGLLARLRPNKTQLDEEIDDDPEGPRHPRDLSSGPTPSGLFILPILHRPLSICILLINSREIDVLFLEINTKFLGQF